MNHDIVGTFLVDGHVHHHAEFETGAFLAGAERNFAAAAARIDRQLAAGWLLLTELPGDDWFGALRSGALRPRGWQVETTEEAESLILLGKAEIPVIVVAGRQIATRERLEVLALGTRSTFADGDDLATTVAAVRAAGALPVVPWGFGKWSGRRAAAVEQVLETAPRPFFLGDNGGRPGWLPAPRAFARAAERGIPVLPGSDPLPLPGESGKVARYGFVLEGRVERARPAAGLRRLLVDLERQPESFGRLERLPAFALKQLAMQWRKHLGVKAAGTVRPA